VDAIWGIWKPVMNIYDFISEKTELKFTDPRISDTANYWELQAEIKLSLPERERTLIFKLVGKKQLHLYHTTPFYRIAQALQVFDTNQKDWKDALKKRVTSYHHMSFNLWRTRYEELHSRLDLILDIIAADTTTDIPATLATLVAAVITNAAGADVAADIIAAKAVLDALNGVAWVDDTQVRRLVVEKSYGTEGRTTVRIT
jgi:hypothetical protein